MVPLEVLSDKPAGNAGLILKVDAVPVKVAVLLLIATPVQYDAVGTA